MLKNTKLVSDSIRLRRKKEMQDAREREWDDRAVRHLGVTAKSRRGSVSVGRGNRKNEYSDDGLSLMMDKSILRGGCRSATPCSSSSPGVGEIPRSASAPPPPECSKQRRSSLNDDVSIEEERMRSNTSHRSRQMRSDSVAEDISDDIDNIQIVSDGCLRAIEREYKPKSMLMQEWFGDGIDAMKIIVPSSTAVTKSDYKRLERDAKLEVSAFNNTHLLRRETVRANISERIFIRRVKMQSIHDELKRVDNVLLEYERQMKDSESLDFLSTEDTTDLLKSGRFTPNGLAEQTRERLTMFMDQQGNSNSIKNDILIELLDWLTERKEPDVMRLDDTLTDIGYVYSPYKKAKMAYDSMTRRLANIYDASRRVKENVKEFFGKMKGLNNGVTDKIREDTLQISNGLEDIQHEMESVDRSLQEGAIKTAGLLVKQQSSREDSDLQKEMLEDTKGKLDILISRLVDSRISKDILFELLDGVDDDTKEQMKNNIRPSQEGEVEEAIESVGRQTARNNDLQWQSDMSTDQDCKEAYNETAIDKETWAVHNDMSDEERHPPKEFGGETEGVVRKGGENGMEKVEESEVENQSNNDEFMNPHSSDFGEDQDEHFGLSESSGTEDFANLSEGYLDIDDVDDDDDEPLEKEFELMDKFAHLESKNECTEFDETLRHEVKKAVLGNQHVCGAQPKDNDISAAAENPVIHVMQSSVDCMDRALNFDMNPSKGKLHPATRQSSFRKGRVRRKFSSSTHGSNSDTSPTNTSRSTASELTAKIFLDSDIGTESDNAEELEKTLAQINNVEELKTAITVLMNYRKFMIETVYSMHVRLRSFITMMNKLVFSPHEHEPLTHSVFLEKWAKLNKSQNRRLNAMMTRHGLRNAMDHAYPTTSDTADDIISTPSSYQSSNSARNKTGSGRGFLQEQMVFILDTVEEERRCKELPQRLMQSAVGHLSKMYKSIKVYKFRTGVRFRMSDKPTRPRFKERKSDIHPIQRARMKINNGTAIAKAVTKPRISSRILSMLERQEIREREWKKKREMMIEKQRNVYERGVRIEKGDDSDTILPSRSLPGRAFSKS